MQPALALWSYLSTRRKIQTAVLLGFMGCSSLFEMLSIGAVIPFLGVLTDPSKVFEIEVLKPYLLFLKISSPNELILPICIIFGSSILISNATRLISFWLSTRLSYGISLDLGLNIFRKILYQPYDFHINKNSSSLAGILNQSTETIACEILPILNLINGILMLFFILVALLAISTPATLITFGGLFVIYILVAKFTREALLLHGRVISNQITNVSKIVHEGLVGIRDIQMDGRHEFFCNLYGKSESRLRFALGSNRMIANFPHYGIESLGYILIIGLAYFLSTSQAEGGILGSLPILGALALGAQRLMPVMQQIYSSTTTIRGNRASLEQILNLLKMQIPAKEIPHLKIILPFNNQISMKSLHYRYQDSTTFVLNDINLTINKGEVLGLMGKTGSGKTTLINIIMGLLSPTSGAVSVDGTLISVSTIEAWQRNIAHVPQDVFLLDGTLEENIAFGIPLESIDKDKILKCIELAQLKDDYQNWPHKLKTKLGERGLKLSGGQRQRIALARAIYKGASVLVFDEATSALDVETEKKVIAAINLLSKDSELNLTIIMIAHRLATLRGCSRIFEIDGGRISRIGGYDSLVASIGSKEN